MKILRVFNKANDNEADLKGIEPERQDSQLNALTVDSYRELKEEVINSLKGLADIYNESGSHNECLRELIDKLRIDNFQIVVLGEFSRGKSTFINTLLNKNILPSNILPTTAVITKIYYSNEPRIKINYKDNKSETIEVTDLKRYITSLESDDIPNQIVDAEIYYPTQFCMDGCSIIDSPGVNDINQQKVDITYNYIPKSDAAIMLLDPDQPFTESEKDFIENKIIDNKISKIFFVLNKFDQVDEANKKEVIQHVKNRLISLKNIGTNNVKLYCLSSKEALKARLKNEDNSYNRDFKKFEKDLMGFLIKEKGKYLLSSTIVKGLTDIQRLEEKLSLYISNLQVSLGELEDKRMEFNRIKEHAISECNEVKRKLDQKYDNLSREVEFKVDVKLNEVFDQIYQMINSMTIHTNNYTEAIPKVMESQITSFVNKTLHPEVMNILDVIRNQLNSTLYNVKGELYRFKNETMEEVQETSITISKNTPSYTMSEMGNQVYLPVDGSGSRDVFSTVTYTGGAIAAGILVAAMITGPIGLILGALAGGAVFKTLDTNKQQRDKNFVFNRLDEIKGTTISKTKAKINQLIKAEYDKLERAIYSQIDDSLNSYEELFNELINEKRDRTRELNEKSENIKEILTRTNGIKEKFNDIMVYMRESV